MASSIANVDEKNIEKGLVSLTPSQNLISEPLPSSTFGKQVGCKKFVISRHNDTELHLAAGRGDLAAVKQILDDIHSRIFGTVSGVEFDMRVAEIRASMVNKVNELGETVLFTAADHGHLDVVKELLKYSSKESLSFKNRSGLDPLHAAAKAGHHAIVQVLLKHDPSLRKTIGPGNATPLVSAAQRGHTAVVNELLSNDCTMLEISRSTGKNALHLAARQGHVNIVKALLDKDPQLARRTDRKGQTALHMAVKGLSCEVVKLLLEADPAIVMLPDKFGKTALHVATRKKRTEFLDELLQLPDVGVNALTRDHKTALDIAEELPLSEESEEIKRCLTRYGSRRANALNFPWEELRVVMNELRELHREGTNNTTNSTAVLFATIAFAAIFTVPGGVQDDGMAIVASRTSFKFFFIFNAVSLFTSLPVVVVHNTFVRGETKVHKRWRSLTS